MCLNLAFKCEFSLLLSNNYVKFYEEYLSKE